ncbi:MAG: hypothetical protein JW834_02675 [Candidatus Diapherotrites archaeon]|nr:hypothetical protein [Candidatus Diapherotrites archaeon]
MPQEKKASKGRFSFLGAPLRSGENIAFIKAGGYKSVYGVGPVVKLLPPKSERQRLRAGGRRVDLVPSILMNRVIKVFDRGEEAMARSVDKEELKREQHLLARLRDLVPMPRTLARVFPEEHGDPRHGRVDIDEYAGVDYEARYRTLADMKQPKFMKDLEEIVEMALRAKASAGVVIDISKLDNFCDGVCLNEVRKGHSVEFVPSPEKKIYVDKDTAQMSFTTRSPRPYENANQQLASYLGHLVGTILEKEAKEAKSRTISRGAERLVVKKLHAFFPTEAKELERQFKRVLDDYKEEHK